MGQKCMVGTARRPGRACWQRQLLWGLLRRAGHRELMSIWEIIGEWPGLDEKEQAPCTREFSGKRKVCRRQVRVVIELSSSHNLSSNHKK